MVVAASSVGRLQECYADGGKEVIELIGGHMFVGVRLCSRQRSRASARLLRLLLHSLLSMKPAPLLTRLPNTWLSLLLLL